MSEDPRGAEDGTETGKRSGRDDGDGDARPTALEADAVRPGDRVVFTSRLDKEYEFTVAEVDPTWLTFETGQMVHKDRFDREDFAVVRTASEASGRVTVEDADGPEPEEAVDEAATAAADGGDARPPNAD